MISQCFKLMGRNHFTVAILIPYFKDELLKPFLSVFIQNRDSQQENI